MPGPEKSLYVRLIGWWYLCLGLAFAALAWRNFVVGESHAGVVLRGIVSAGFSLLGVLTLRSARK